MIAPLLLSLALMQTPAPKNPDLDKPTSITCVTKDGFNGQWCEAGQTSSITATDKWPTTLPVDKFRLSNQPESIVVTMPALEKSAKWTFTINGKTYEIDGAMLAKIVALFGEKK